MEHRPRNYSEYGRPQQVNGVNPLSMCGFDERAWASLLAPGRLPGRASRRKRGRPPFLPRPSAGAFSGSPASALAPNIPVKVMDVST
jgi:hypothetical protein